MQNFRMHLVPQCLRLGHICEGDEGTRRNMAPHCSRSRSAKQVVNLGTAISATMTEFQEKYYRLVLRDPQQTDCCC